MQRNYRFSLSIITVILSGVFAFAQADGQYRNVTLNGKPAKLNIVTGEITVVDSEGKIVSVKSYDTIENLSSKGKDTIGSQLKTDFHIVREKETLLDIANKYNTTLTELKRINNLETTLVDKGQILRVRDFEIEKETILGDTTNEVVPEPEEVLTPSNETRYTKSTTDIHIVEKGQTLYSLAKLYGLSVNELKLQNGLNSNLIIVGQELRIANFDSNNSAEQLSIWMVSKGDTLYSIAKKNNLTVDQLKAMNNLQSNLILVGQKLKLK